MIFTTSEKPFHLWGILNCTPDSFYDGCGEPHEKRIDRALAMVQSGASVIDVGGESTRPGAQPVGAQEEIDRVLPVIEGLRSHSEVIISIDTSKAPVAQEALRAGAQVINDVTAGSDPDMAPLAGRSGCVVVLMHMQGSPRTMQVHPSYENVVEQVLHHLQSRKNHFLGAGLKEASIMLDPGIGFGKNLEHNLQLISSLDQFQAISPVLLGVSRKSFISGVDPSATGPENRLPGSLASVAIALNCGVKHFRVHDVGATRQFITVYQRLLEMSP